MSLFNIVLFYSSIITRLCVLNKDTQSINHFRQWRRVHGFRNGGGGLRNILRASASVEGHCRRYCELNAETNFPDKKHQKRQKCHLAMILFYVISRHKGMGGLSISFFTGALLATLAPKVLNRGGAIAPPLAHSTLCH